jgi:CO/xanthine dehydrogenase Mo-binding subunit
MRRQAAGLRRDGDFDTGAYASWGPTVANRVPVHAMGPYAVPNVRTWGEAFFTNGRRPAPSAASACRRPRSRTRR